MEAGDGAGGNTGAQSSAVHSWLIPTLPPMNMLTFRSKGLKQQRAGEPATPSRGAGTAGACVGPAPPRSEQEPEITQLKLLTPASVAASTSSQRVSCSSAGGQRSGMGSRPCWALLGTAWPDPRARGGRATPHLVSWRSCLAERPVLPSEAYLTPGTPALLR